MEEREKPLVHHPIEALMSAAMENLRDMVDVNTVVGDAVESPDGTLIIPISRVSFGFAAGGSQFETHERTAAWPFGGGSGAGVSIRPVGFLVVGHGDVRLVPVSPNGALYDRLVDLVPDIVAKIEARRQKEAPAASSERRQAAEHAYTDDADAYDL